LRLCGKFPDNFCRKDAKTQRHAKRAAPDRVAPDRAAPDKAAPDRAAPDKAAPDKAAPDRAAPDKAAIYRKESKGAEGQRTKNRRRTAKPVI
jgi:ATP-dependent Lhr-like helicase